MTNIRYDVDRVWAAMLDDDPGPPALPPAEDVLAVARASRRRRRAALTVASSGLAGLLVIAGVSTAVALVGPAVATTGPDRIAGPPPVVEAPLLPLPVPPGWEAADAQGPQRAAVLLANIPAGYTGVVQQKTAATFLFGNTDRYGSSVDVVLTTGQADGLLSVDLRNDTPDVGGDLCSAAADAHLAILYPESPPTTCDAVVINGVQVRVVSLHEQGKGDVNRAFRLLDGGLIAVEAWQGIPVHGTDDSAPPDATNPRRAEGEHTTLGGWPALPAVPLTTAQLAAIAANPALLP